MRDDFTGRTIDTLAKRVGFRCSNPDCRRQTVGPHSQPEKSLLIGVAAHITAASPGGPRFNAAMTNAERKVIGNGIWLCNNCSTLIDKDVNKFNVDLLIAWKTVAEREASLIDFDGKIRKVNKRHYAVSVDYIERNISSYDDQGKEQKRLNLIDVYKERPVDKPIRLVLLSTAGFGKSEELLHFSAWISTQSKSPDIVLFSLRDFVGQSIETILSNYDKNWQNIDEKDLFMVFDGLDEITDQYIRTFTGVLNSFLDLHPRISCLVSSRFNFYDIGQNTLRDFRLFVLEPFTPEAINEFLSKKLEGQKELFEQLMRDRRFDEYLYNPYYVTRLVRLFLADNGNLPKNKSELFRKILFEQLEKTAAIRDFGEWESDLIPGSEQIAFSMTLAGKSSISDQELKILVPDKTLRNGIKKFSILSRHAGTVGSWSFEHKNLQEYLCASALARWSFSKIQPVISYHQDNRKLLPQLLNTVSFLFELTGAFDDKRLFNDLFGWIHTNEPELLIRFEKEQVDKSTRDEIFRKIFGSYKAKGITMMISSNFSLSDLARFVDFDAGNFDYLASEIRLALPEPVLLDAINLLALVERPYRFKDKISAILFSILKDQSYIAKAQAFAIHTFYYLSFNNKEIFKSILVSGVDLTKFEIRKACVMLLESGTYAEEFLDLVVESIPYLEEGQRRYNLIGTFMTLIRLILSFTEPQSLKRILQLCIADHNIVGGLASHREFQFTVEETIELLRKASIAFKKEKTMLPTAYRLYCGLEYLGFEDKLQMAFREFFAATCGTACIFHKFYRYGKKERELMLFVDKEGCDFLLDEFKKQKLTREYMVICRNSLSYLNRKLCTYLNNKLVEIDSSFKVDDLQTDYAAMRKVQLRKNQEMILNKVLFQEEADKLFLIIAKDKITVEDLEYTENIGLRLYAGSIVLEAIRDCCFGDDGKTIDKEEFYIWLMDESAWDRFQIISIKKLLRKDKSSVDSALISHMTNWCTEMIRTIDFTNSITDNEDGSYNYYYLHELVKETFLLLGLDLPDDQYLKLLPLDTVFFYSSSKDQNTLSAAIIKNVRDRSLLRAGVLILVKNERFSYLVRCSLFTICHILRYAECLPELFNMITGLAILSGEDRRKLSEYYLDLGGDIGDFREYLAIPELESQDEHFGSWQWFLLDKLRSVENGKVVEILLKVIEAERNHNDKLKAAELLIRNSRVEGLLYWSEFVRETKKLPTNFRWESLISNILAFPFFQVLDIFLDVLISCYDTDHLHSRIEPKPIDETVYNVLIALSLKSHSSFIAVKAGLEELMIRYSETTRVIRLTYALERLSQQYYMSQNNSMDIQAANVVYKAYLSMATKN